MTATLNIKRLEWKIQTSGLTVPKQIRKRDGSISRFDPQRIAKAVESCFSSISVTSHTEDDVTEQVVRLVSARYEDTPTVEQVQDSVVSVLYALGEVEAAKNYSSYRELHKSERDTRPVPDEVKAAFEEDKKYFPTASQQFMFYDKYSRYNYDLGRRETWKETVDRTVEHLRWLVEENAPHALVTFEKEKTFEKIHDYILNMKAMPAMRMLAMAGEAARRNGIAGYNCSFAPVRDIYVFVEALLISMAGAGFAFSVERRNVEQLPRIKRQSIPAIVEYHEIEDSTEGWGEALHTGLKAWFSGTDVKFDDSFVRPAGSVLRTKGGRASGPEPLMKMLSVAREIILSRQGGFLTPADAHLLLCAVGEAAIQGGVRRTAELSLFDFDDKEMRNIKNTSGFNPLLWNANNSSVWHDEIRDVDIIEQMTEMVRGGAGEPGIFSRANAKNTRPSRRQDAEFGTNSCAEINLRPYGFCNLTIAVVRSNDTLEDLKKKVEISTVLGTIQSLATHFPGLRDEWKKNCEEERLLGVDLAGQMDHPVLQLIGETGEQWREELKEHAISVNQKWAEVLDINPSASITCNKPSGNSSELLNMASGIHARHSQYYTRNMRISSSSPLFKVMRSAGVPMDPENGQNRETANTWVIHFPVKSPEGAVVKSDRSAVDQCEFWKLNKLHWTEHNPSVTINYHENEIMDLIAWVVKNKNIVGGMSFIPVTTDVYSQMPYETLTEEEYNKAVAKFPKEIDYSKIYRYELDDYTTASRELSCFAGSCEV